MKTEDKLRMFIEGNGGTVHMLRSHNVAHKQLSKVQQMLDNMQTSVSDFIDEHPDTSTIRDVGMELGSLESEFEKWFKKFTQLKKKIKKV